jgi:hypothetical protein
MICPDCDLAQYCRESVTYYENGSAFAVFCEECRTILMNGDYDNYDYDMEHRTLEGLKTDCRDRELSVRTGRSSNPRAVLLGRIEEFEKDEDRLSRELQAQQSSFYD